MMKGLTVEVAKGDVDLVPSNLLIKDLDDMEILEYWEERLDLLKQPYVIAYKEVKGRVLYYIFTNLKEKGSAFR